MRRSRNCCSFVMPAVQALTVCLCFCLQSERAEAQWLSNGYGIYTDSGNVGIGTETPNHKLQVKGPDFQIAVQSDGTGANRANLVFLNTAGSVRGGIGLVGADDRIRIGNATDYVITVGQDGNVGIGSTNPEQKLDVSSSGTTMIRVAGTGDNYINSAILLQSQDDDVNYRGNGLYMHSVAGSNEWYAGKPYADADSYVISRKSNVASHDSSTAQNVHALLKISNGGNVGIGTSAPEAKLDIRGFLQISNPHSHIKLTGASSNGMLMVAGNNLMMGNWEGVQKSISVDLTNGNVGIGTTSPSGKLHVNSPDASAALVMGSTANAYYTDAIWLSNAGSAEIFKTGTSYSGWGGPRSFNVYTADGPIAFHPKGSANVMYLSEAGNVGIGTTNPAARLHVDGNIVATTMSMTYQDIAEWVPSSKPISAGTVVIVDAEIDNQVLVSSKAYDTRVAGVVSDSPGVLLGVAGEGKVKVATTGRVRVKADASTGSIRKGDLLVTSGKEGLAMKSEPVEVAGVSMHRPGTLIGKALQSLEEGEGEILVLLSLQ